MLLLVQHAWAAAAAGGAEGAFDDDPGPLKAFDRAVVEAALAPEKLSALVDELLAALQAPGATRLQTQDAAQHLGQVLPAAGQAAKAEALAVLGPMLAQPEHVENARLALDRVPGADVDAQYVQALQVATGATRIALIQSVAAREIDAAIPALKALLADDDPTTRAEAGKALGRIGGAEALAALATAKDPLAPEVLDARLAAAVDAGSDLAARVAAEIFENEAAPKSRRAAALAVLIRAKPAAGGIISDVLKGDDAMFRQIAIGAITEIDDADMLAEIGGLLSEADVALQVPLLAAIAQSPAAAAATPAVLRALEAGASEVRLAAIAALGRMPGTTAVAERLAAIAAGSGAEARAATDSLARLRGPGIDEFVRARAAEGAVKLRAVYVRQIALRNLTGEIPFLLGLRSAPEPELRLEALDALRVIAPPAQQTAVIEWALGTEDRAEQNRAARALIAIILRDDDVATRTRHLVAALERADNDGRLVLLPVLSRVANEETLAAAGRFAMEANPEVAAAAVRELARWPDASALPLLVDVAMQTKVLDVREQAVRGAADFLARDRTIPPDQRSVHARTLIDLPLGAPAKNALLHVLSLCADEAALATVRRYADDPATAKAARDAIDALQSNLAGPPDFKASHDEAGLVHLADGDATTFWSAPNERGVWLFADMKHARPVRKVTLSQADRGWGYPARLQVFVSDDPEARGEPLAEVEGERDETIVMLPAGVHGRYLWLEQTGVRDAPWMIAELLVE